MRHSLKNHNALIACLIAICIYTGADIWQTLTWPPFFSFDETLDIDYIYQLSQRRLPTFWGGVRFNPLNLHYPQQVHRCSMCWSFPYSLPSRP